MNRKSNFLDRSTTNNSKFFIDSCDFSKRDVESSADWEKINTCLQLGLTVVVSCTQKKGSPVKIHLLASFNSKKIAEDYATKVSMGSDESAWVDTVWPENYQA